MTKRGGVLFFKYLCPLTLEILCAVKPDDTAFNLCTARKFGVKSFRESRLVPRAACGVEPYLCENIEREDG